MARAPYIYIYIYIYIYKFDMCLVYCDMSLYLLDILRIVMFYIEESLSFPLFQNCKDREYHHLLSIIDV